MKTDFSKLIDYVDNWHKIEGIKPSNEPLFVLEFVELLKNFPDEREITFDGEGAYFGKQVTIEPFSFYGKSARQLAFEIAYSNDIIRVYNADHHGFWNPEFINMDKSNIDFEDLKRELFDFLTKIFGLKQ